MAASGEEAEKNVNKTVDYDELKTQITNKLQKRDQERIEDAEKKRTEKECGLSEKETADFFNENFARERVLIKTELEKSTELPKSDLADHFDKLMVSLQNLQKFVSDSTLFLPSYEVRHAQDVLANLQASITEKREELLPKKKFAFKAKKKVVEAAPKRDIPDERRKDFVDVALSSCGFKNERNKTLELNDFEINNKDVSLSKLTNCKVILKGAPCAIHIDKLENCVVLSGPVSGSIFVNDCVGCKFVVACQQLRTHSTKNSTFYLHVTSRGIIEDCNNVMFAPYNLQYPELDAHYSVSGLDKLKNNWNDIDDFNWLASDKHSPNWSVLPESERSHDWM